MLKFLFYAYSPITSFTINISVIFREVSWLKQFLTAAAVKTKFVENIPFCLLKVFKIKIKGQIRNF